MAAIVTTHALKISLAIPFGTSIQLFVASKRMLKGKKRKNEREVIGRSVFIAGKKCERNGRVLPR